MTHDQSEKSPVITAFKDSFDYLDICFSLVSDRPAFAERIGALPFISERTELSLAAGISLPFEDFVQKHDIDFVERLILLALLRAAHDPGSKGGIPLARLFEALGADSLARRQVVLTVLESAGTLRDLGAIHCFPSPNNESRSYRLAPWLVGPLTTGEGSEEGLPELSADPIAALEETRWDAGKVLEALNFNTSNPILIWQAPAAGRPGWDHMALRRLRLAARLEAHFRSESSPIGAEIRRLGLEGDERLAWFLLLHDAQVDPVGVAVPTLVRFSGAYADPATAAERLFGEGSKLGRAGVLRLNRDDGPLLARVAWLTREASARVVPWPRDAFSVRPGEDGEPTAVSNRRVGFGFGGNEVEDRAAARVRERGAA